MLTTSLNDHVTFQHGSAGKHGFGVNIYTFTPCLLQHFLFEEYFFMCFVALERLTGVRYRNHYFLKAFSIRPQLLTKKFLSFSYQSIN